MRICTIPHTFPPARLDTRVYLWMREQIDVVRRGPPMHCGVPLGVMLVVTVLHALYIRLVGLLPHLLLLQPVLHHQIKLLLFHKVIVAFLVVNAVRPLRGRCFLRPMLGITLARLLRHVALPPIHDSRAPLLEHR